MTRGLVLGNLRSSGLKGTLHPNCRLHLLGDVLHLVTRGRRNLFTCSDLRRWWRPGRFKFRRTYTYWGGRVKPETSPEMLAT